MFEWPGVIAPARIARGPADRMVREAQRGDARLPAIVGAVAKSVLVIDDVPTLKGPSTLVELAATALQEWPGTARLVLATGGVPGHSRASLRWAPASSYRVRFVGCSGPSLVGISVGGSPQRSRDLRIGDGLAVHFAVQNRSERNRPAAMLFITESHFARCSVSYVNLEVSEVVGAGAKRSVLAATRAPSQLKHIRRC